jgi:hypothetical protein
VRTATTQMTDQLQLNVPEHQCEGCDGARFVEPHFDGMDPEPCVLCCDNAWDKWMRDPYGLLRSEGLCQCGARLQTGRWAPCLACRIRQHDRHFRRPVMVGQLGLGFG